MLPIGKTESPSPAAAETTMEVGRSVIVTHKIQDFLALSIREIGPGPMPGSQDAPADNEDNQTAKQPGSYV